MDLGGSDTQKLKIHFVNHIDQCLVRSLRGDHCADESECIVSVHNICFLNHDAKLIRRCAKLKHNGGSFSHKNKKRRKSSMISALNSSIRIIRLEQLHPLGKRQRMCRNQRKC